MIGEPTAPESDRTPQSERAPAEEGEPATPAEEPGPDDPTPRDHVAERRHRAFVTPEDHALYRCECGYQFEASVSASVACPHCGRGQAW